MSFASGAIVDSGPIGLNEQGRGHSGNSSRSASTGRHSHRERFIRFGRRPFGAQPHERVFPSSSRFDFTPTSPPHLHTQSHTACRSLALGKRAVTRSSPNVWPIKSRTTLTPLHQENLAARHLQILSWPTRRDTSPPLHPC